MNFRLWLSDELGNVAWLSSTARTIPRIFKTATARVPTLIKVIDVLSRSQVQSKGLKNTFEVGLGSREAYMLRSIIRTRVPAR